MKQWYISLVPFSWAYGFGIWLRNLAYDIGIFRVERLDVPVLSVGNLTTGGTGKTPFVEYLLRYLLAHQKKVAVISRGYKRKTKGTVVVSDGTNLMGNAKTAGDEPYQVARKFPSAVVIVDERRARAARYARKYFAVDVVVLDDGFQHRALGRDLDIVMIDGKKSAYHTPMLPAGERRESFSSLRRAHVLAFCHSVDDTGQTDVILKYTQAASIEVRFEPKQLCQLVGDHVLGASDARGKSCVAFCGIANPLYFGETLHEIELRVLKSFVFPDHYYFRISDLRKIQEAYHQSRADFIVTTEKDAVRLLTLGGAEFLDLETLYYLEIEVSIPRGETTLHQIISSVLQGETRWS